MGVEQHISELDTKRFGYKVARINEFSTDYELILQKLKKFDVRLVISRINSNEIQLINKLEDKGFRIKDTQLILKHELNNTEQFKIDLNYEKNILIRESKISEAEEIAKIAFNSFEKYGHYSENLNLPLNKVAEIYYDWAFKSCIDKNVADKVVIAVENSKIIGFVSIKLHNKLKSPFSFLNVGAIDKNYRNRGLFRLLIKKCLVLSGEYNMKWSETKILTINIPVNRSLHNLGFKFNGSEHTLHCWL
jgi:hypothetical protein